jgi:hypothetical protein
MLGHDVEHAQDFRPVAHHQPVTGLAPAEEAPYWRMTARWRSLRRGKGKPWVLAY